MIPGHKRINSASINEFYIEIPASSHKKSKESKLVHGRQITVGHNRINTASLDEFRLDSQDLGSPHRRG